MKKLRSITALLALSVALAACTGDNGEPGPKGDTGAEGTTGATGATGPAGEGIQKAGYIQGNVTGKLANGKTLDENFKYEYGPASLYFYESNGSKWINIFRYNESSFTSSRLELQSLKSDGNTIAAVPNSTGISFDFYKEINATDLLEVSVVPYFKDREAFVVRLSDEQNKTYNFFTNEGNIYTYGTVWSNGGNTEAANLFYDAAQQYEIYYSSATGALLGIYDQKTEGVLTSGLVFDLYNKIVYKNNSNLNQFTFFDKTSKASLHSITPATPADQFIITNYVHDATTGILTFDYKLTISRYRAKNGGNYGKNSTGNDLTITGSYNSGGKVYKNKVNRVGS